MDEAPLPASRDPWAVVAFVVPTALALIAGLYGVIDQAIHQSGDGYQGLAYIAGMVIGVPAILVWMGIGAAVAKSRGPPGASRRFVTASFAAIGAVLLVLTATCFLSYSV
ncbi:MAG TPA: hypothetical protein VM370_04365 [Candidatus Thermoplasmatota archaeon]|nr:hypothetical protein [Candidatus Thermoplasmatota archaeon]